MMMMIKKMMKMRRRRRMMEQQLFPGGPSSEKQTANLISLTELQAVYFYHIKFNLYINYNICYYSQSKIIEKKKKIFYNLMKQIGFVLNWIAATIYILEPRTWRSMLVSEGFYTIYYLLHARMKLSYCQPTNYIAPLQFFVPLLLASRHLLRMLLVSTLASIHRFTSHTHTLIGPAKIYFIFIIISRDWKKPAETCANWIIILYFARWFRPRARLLAPHIYFILFYLFSQVWKAHCRTVSFIFFPYCYPLCCVSSCVCVCVCFFLFII